MRGIGIIGSNGAVGSELAKLLTAKNLPFKSYGREDKPSFDKLDIAFFCAQKEAAEKLIPKAIAQGVTCIDASTAYRMKAPLIIPEVNLEVVKEHQGVIASPNCTTTLMLLALAPLHNVVPIRRVIATTYQAVSGAGTKGILELKEQTAACLKSKEIKGEVFPHQTAFNIFPHESEMLPSGYVLEEEKMHEETRVILNDHTISVSARCVRVPVIRVHSLALNVKFEHEIEPKEAEEILKVAPGLILCNENPTPIMAEGKHEVFCGPVRRDRTSKKSLELWIVGDQLLKGAALNMLQIAEGLV